MHKPIAILLAAISCIGSAEANLFGVREEKRLVLEKENVHIEIEGDRAHVRGTFQFDVKGNRTGLSGLDLFLPVYAEPGTDPATLNVVIGLFEETGEGSDLLDQEPPIRKLQVLHYKKEPPVVELPTIKGQQVFWFVTKVRTAEMEKSGMQARIYYEQPLNDGTFIYTPIIPEQVKDRDYGSIHINSDQPLQVLGRNAYLKDADDTLIFTPSHKEAIIIRKQVAEK